MFLTHLRAAGFVLQECMESSLLHSQDAQSSPEKEGVVASGCERSHICPTSVPREIPCDTASPSRMMPKAVNPQIHKSRRSGRSRCHSQLQAGGSIQIAARLRAEGTSRDKSWCRAQVAVQDRASPRRSQLLAGMEFPPGMPKPVEKQR